ncbi:MAG: ribonuclease HI [Patescibacteria group bacterium]|nr:ribonuclease HI [Patescibacteria group bacterium]
MVEIYTDGSSINNPGPGGWGVVVVSSNKTIAEYGGSEKKTTNNRMELVGAIEALKYCLSYEVKAKIYVDSEYVLKGITEWILNWEKNGWKTANKKPVLNKDLWQELSFLQKECDVVWKKIEAHAGHKFNEKADGIAQRYARKC